MLKTLLCPPCQLKLSRTCQQTSSMHTRFMRPSEQGTCRQEIGPVNHSRWLTTATRFLRIWCSKHGLKGKNLENLKQIVYQIMKVYIPNWFNTKIKHNWIQGPHHVLFQLQTFRNIKLETQNTLKEHVQRSTVTLKTFFSTSCAPTRRRRGGEG